MWPWCEGVASTFPHRNCAAQKKLMWLKAFTVCYIYIYTHICILYKLYILYLSISYHSPDENGQVPKFSEFPEFPGSATTGPDLRHPWDRDQRGTGATKVVVSSWERTVWNNYGFKAVDLRIHFWDSRADPFLKDLIHDGTVAVEHPQTTVIYSLKTRKFHFFLKCVCVWVWQDIVFTPLHVGRPPTPQVYFGSKTSCSTMLPIGASQAKLFSLFPSVEASQARIFTFPPRGGFPS